MKPLFIAEIGINHHGDFEKALRMIDKAKKAGAHVAKFQHYDAVKVLGADHPALEYASNCQFSKLQHEKLKDHCDQRGIEYLVSVFDVADIAWANGLCQGHKIASRMNHNRDFIKAIQATHKPVLMSIQKPEERRDYANFSFMWCVRDYPCAKAKALDFVFNERYGLSSHCPDWTVIPDAYKLGARVFENHVVESLEEDGCDVASSLSFEDYEKAIKACA
jgi:sialic acid synthase SpsE